MSPSLPPRCIILLQFFDLQDTLPFPATLLSLLLYRIGPILALTSEIPPEPILDPYSLKHTK
jgi:hypothetical protein